MQLLYSRSGPGTEFASVSLLLKSDIGKDRVSSRMSECMVLPSPLSTMSQTSCMEAVKELHQYLSCVIKSTRYSTETKSGKMTSAMFQEDEKQLDNVQIFRPLKGHGIGLHYRLIRDRSAMSTFIPLVFKASKATSTTSSGIDNDVTGIVLCVAMAGIPSAIVSSSLHHSLSQRMTDCVDLLSKLGPNDAAASNVLLTTLLLTEDEDRLTNPMAEAATRTILSVVGDETLFGDGKQAGKIFGGGKRKNQDAVMPENDGGDVFCINSADHARVMVERLAVLSVAEDDTILRKFESRANAGEKSSKTRRRKVGRDADLDGFDFRGERRSSKRELSSASLVSDNTSVKSGASKVHLKQPKNDTTSRAYGKSRNASVPPLLANVKDSGSRNRRSSVDNGARGAGNSRSGTNRRASNNSAVSSADWIFDTNGNAFNTDASKQRSVGSIHFDGSESLSSSRAPGSSAGRSGRSRQPFYDPFNGDATSSTASETTMSTRRTRNSHDDDPHYHQQPQNDGNLDSHFGSSDAFGGQNELMHNRVARSSRSLEHSIEGGPRVQVNVALNEDLTCFYNLSKMSSCTVEGVVQVQVKSNTQSGGPFSLLVRDPSNHILSIQENKKFADNMASSLAREPPSTRPDFKFTVSVPRADNYFPVMRYKCGSELRPVPIRVQTRVRLEETHWRVALQISSNPHNEDNLTDLTIIMGVPRVVRGESLTTSPPGGVWNAAKRSVIWCVSELGGGEKFQLQARFEIDNDTHVPPDEKPKFPVLVRCQCMYAQLSDVEVDVRDIPEIFPAEVRMKLARRFRLSHRERP